MKKKVIKATVAISLAAIFGLTASGASIPRNNSENIGAFNSSETKKVIVGGFPFGVKLMCDGVIVIEISDLTKDGKKMSPAKDAGLQSNDVIIAADGQNINSNEALSEMIAKCTQSINLTVQRKDKIFDAVLIPQEDDSGVKRAGMWIRDSAAGIGTVSYIDPQNCCIAGLGHGICDSDTEMLMPLESGEICRAVITTVTKSEKGNIGGLNGYFENETIGDLEINDDYGIYARSIAENENNMLTEVADISQISLGNATVITTINGSTPKEYSAVIESIDRGNEKATKNMIIRITDPELLNTTGGIVQGMSGSPILQNGRLIGAITHVFVNSPEKGYAIFARNMIEKFEEYRKNKSADAA